MRHCGVVLVTADAVATTEKKMSKLTDTQLIVLSKAARRDDGAAVVPERVNKAAAAKIAASLVARKLMREIRAKPGMPVWREDGDGRRVSLVILRAGRDAIGVEDFQDEEPALTVADRAAPKPPETVQQPDQSTPRAGSKQALVIAMLSSGSGATIDALIAATGWLPHTTRAALTGLRKRGFAIERMRGEDKITRYSLREQLAAGASAAG